MANELIHIAGLSIPLHQVDEVLAELDTLYDQFRDRGDLFKASNRNPHLCRAGCSQCCRRGAIFAVTLVEAVRWSQAIAALPVEVQAESRRSATALFGEQRRVFSECAGPPDVPGQRGEAAFSRRVARLSAMGPGCPLLAGDLCSVYEDRPMLCRAYGFPVDAYAVESDAAIVFRSLCVLYEGTKLVDFVRAKDLKVRLAELSHRLGGRRDWGRFTSLEAILAHVGPELFMDGGETAYGNADSRRPNAIG